MRRAVILLVPLFIAVMIVAKRSYESLPFISIESYVQSGMVAYYALLLLLLIAILALVWYNQEQYHFPEDSLLLIAASPLILASLTSTIEPLIGACIALIALVVWNKNKTLLALAIASPLLVAGASMISMLVTIVLATRKKYVLAILGLAASIAWIVVQPPTFAMPALQEIGAVGGQSLLLLLLAVSGLILTWNKNTYKRLLILSLFIFVALFTQELAIAATIAIAFLGGYALQELRTREWRLEGIQYASMLFVVLGLLFLAANTAAEVGRAQPDAELVEIADILASAKATSIYSQQPDATYLKALGVEATRTSLPEVTRDKTIEDIRPILPRYLVLQPNQDHALRFFIENTDDFILLYDGNRQLWGLR